MPTNNLFDFGLNTQEEENQEENQNTGNLFDLIPNNNLFDLVPSRNLFDLDSKKEEKEKIAEEKEKNIIPQIRQVSLTKQQIIDGDGIILDGKPARLGDVRQGISFDAFDFNLDPSKAETPEQREDIIYKLAVQKQAAGRILDKSPFAVTNEDLQQLAKINKNALVSEIIDGQVDLTKLPEVDPEVPGHSKLINNIKNLFTGDRPNLPPIDPNEIVVNVPDNQEFLVNVLQVSEGAYGRPIVQLFNATTGASINDNLNTPRLNAVYWSKFNAAKQSGDIAKHYAEQAAKKESRIVKIKTDGIFKALGFDELEVLQRGDKSEESPVLQTIVAATTDILNSTVGLAGMAADLPLAGQEYLFNNEETKRIYKESIDGTFEPDEEDSIFLNTIGDLITHNTPLKSLFAAKYFVNKVQTDKQAEVNLDRIRNFRKGVAGTFHTINQLIDAGVNPDQLEETVVKLGTAYDNETFGRDFIGILANNPEATIRVIAQSLPHMYAAAAKGTRIPFAAAFTNENYNLAKDQFREEFGREPENDEKLLMLSGAALIAAMNSAAANYVVNGTGVIAKNTLNKFGAEGVGNFLNATAIRVGKTIPDNVVTNIAGSVLKGANTLQKPVSRLAFGSTIEYFQEGSESLITTASVRGALDFTEQELKEANVAGALGFGAATGTSGIFSAARFSGRVVQGTQATIKSNAENKELRDKVSKFRQDINDKVVPPSTDIDIDSDQETDEAYSPAIAVERGLEEKPTTEFMRDVANLSAELSGLTPKELKLRKGDVTTLNTGLAKIRDLVEQEAKDAGKEIEKDLNSNDPKTVQRTITRVLRSRESAISPSIEIIDLALSKIDPNTGSKDDYNSLKEYRRKLLEEAKDDQFEVNNDILFGGVNSQFVGVVTRQYIAEKFLESGNVAEAENQLEEIRRFYKAHKEKADLYLEAYNKFLSDGKTRYIIDGKIFDNIPDKLKETRNYDFEVSSNAKGFVGNLILESRQIKNVGISLSRLVNKGKIDEIYLREKNDPEFNKKLNVPISGGIDPDINKITSAVLIPHTDRGDITREDLNTFVSLARRGNETALQRLREYRNATIRRIKQLEGKKGGILPGEQHLITRYEKVKKIVSQIEKANKDSAGQTDSTDRAKQDDQASKTKESKPESKQKPINRKLKIIIDKYNLHSITRDDLFSFLKSANDGDLDGFKRIKELLESYEEIFKNAPPDAKVQYFGKPTTVGKAREDLDKIAKKNEELKANQSESNKETKREQVTDKLKIPISKHNFKKITREDIKLFFKVARNNIEGFNRIGEFLNAYREEFKTIENSSFGLSDDLEIEYLGERKKVEEARKSLNIIRENYIKLRKIIKDEADQKRAKQSKSKPKSNKDPNVINVYHGTKENAVFSNLAERPFEYLGHKFRSVEHAYQSLKSGSLDEKTFEAYNKLGNVNGIKIQGKQALGKFGTKEARIALMKHLVFTSFLQNPEAARLLISTGKAKFTHTQDRSFWGKAFPEILQSVRFNLIKRESSNIVKNKLVPEGIENLPKYDQETGNFSKSESTVKPEQKTEPEIESESEIESEPELVQDERNPTNPSVDIDPIRGTISADLYEALLIAEASFPSNKTENFVEDKNLNADINQLFRFLRNAAVHNDNLKGVETKEDFEEIDKGKVIDLEHNKNNPYGLLYGSVDFKGIEYKNFQQAIKNANITSQEDFNELVTSYYISDPSLARYFIALEGETFNYNFGKLGGFKKERKEEVTEKYNKALLEVRTILREMFISINNKPELEKTSTNPTSDNIVEEESTIDEVVEDIDSKEELPRVTEKESVIIKIRDEAKDSDSKPIELPARGVNTEKFKKDAKANKFNIKNVTLGAFFSREKKTFENEEVEPLDKTDEENLYILDNFYNSFKSILEKLPSLVGSKIRESKDDGFEGKLEVFNTKKGKERFINKLSSDVLFEDMAQLLLTTTKENGVIKAELPEDVMLATFIGAYDWMANFSRKTLWNSDELINQLLNQSPNTIVNDQQRAAFINIGSFRTFVAKSIGKNIYKSLALKPAASIPLVKERMELSLGLLGLKVLIAQGLVTETEGELGQAGELSVSRSTIQEKGAKEFFIRIATDPKDKNKESETAAKVIDDFRRAIPTIKKIFNVSTYERRPLEKPSKRKATVARGNFFKLSEKVTEDVEILQNVPWTLNNTAKIANKLSDGILKKIYGFAEDIEETKHVTRRNSLRSVNRKIEDDILYAKEQFEEFGKEPRDFYFGFEVWGNSRLGIDSNTFNPQASKYHRHLTSPAKNISRIKKKQSRENFMIGINLAFKSLVKKKFPGFSDKGELDNFNDSDYTEFQFDSIIQNEDIKAAVKVLREIKAKDKKPTAKQEEILLKAIELSGEGFHALEALEALSTGLNKNTGKLKKDFYTTFVVETDGVTSGIILGLMQSPIINGIGTWLGRGGIFTGGFKNFGEFKEKERNDAYQYLAVAVSNAVSLKDDRDDDKAKFKALIDIIGHIAAPDAELDENGNFTYQATSLGRDLMKNPLLVFGYGAGIRSIKNTINSQILNLIYKEIERVNLLDSKDKEKELNELFDNISTIMDFNKNKKEIEKKKFKENPLEWQVSLKDFEKFEKGIDEAIGNDLSEQLEIIFEPLLKQKKAMLQGLSIAFHAFKRFYDRERRIYLKENYSDENGKYDDKRVLTKSEKKLILDKVKGVIPFFNSPTSKSDDPSVVSILTEEIIQSTASVETKAESFYNNEIVKDIPRKRRKNIANPNSVEDEFSHDSASARAKDKRFAIDSVAALVKMIHTIDSTLILDAMTRRDENGKVLHTGVPLHDAQMTKVDEIHEATRYYNELVFKVGKNYNMLQDIVNMMNGVIDNVRNLEKAEGKPVGFHTSKILDDVNKEERTRLSGEKLKEFDEGTNLGRTDDIEQRLAWIKQIADNVTAAKEILFNNIEYVSQSAFPSQASVYKNPDVNLTIPADLPTADIVPDYDYKKQEYTKAELKDLTREEIKENIEKASNRTLASSEENLENFELSFEEHATAETSQTIFNVLSQKDNVNENSGHQRYLRAILDNIINKSLKPTEKFIIQVSENAVKNVGDITGNTIRINLAPNRPPVGLNQSANEIYIHELLHGLSVSEIDSNQSLRRRLEELFKIAKANLKPEDFIPEGIRVNDNIKKQAQARYDYIFNNIHSVKDDKSQSGKHRIEGSNGLYEFLAFGLSNEQFVKKLSNIKYKEDKKEPANLFEKLLNVFKDMLDFLLSKYRGTSDVNSDVYSQLYRLTEDIVGIHEGWRTPVGTILNGLQAVSDNTSEFVEDKLERVRLKINRSIEKDESVVRRSIVTLANSAKAARNSEVGEFTINFLQKHVEADGFVATVFRDLTGGSQHFKMRLPYLRYSKKRVENARIAAKANIVHSLKNSFTQELTDTDKEIIHDAFLKTDLVSLLPKNPTNEQINEFINKISDKKETKKEIDKLIAILDNSKLDKGTVNYYINQANNLGHFMATGDSYLLHANLNAYNIARKALTEDIKEKPNKNLIKLIDQLASLYAVTYSKENDIKGFKEIAINELRDGNPENGIQQIIQLANTHKDYSRDILFKDEEYRLIKGFTSQNLDPHIDVQFAKANSERQEELEKMGYKQAIEIENDEIFGGNPVIMYTAFTGAAVAFQKTTFSTTSESTKGTTLSEIVGKDYDNRLGGVQAIRLASIKAFAEGLEDTKEQHAERFGDVGGRSLKPVSLIPVSSAEGEPYDYRVIMNDEIRKDELGADTRVDEILGSMYANMVDKMASREINTQVINDIYEDYKNNFEKEPDHFVRVGIGSKYDELWAVIPDGSKEQILRLFKRRGFYIRKELVDVVMGYRKFSITQTKRFKKLPPKARIVTEVAEKVWQEIAAYGAVQIVIKTPIVLFDNILSNTITLIRDRVNITKIANDYKVAIRGLNDYRETDQQIFDLKLKLKQDINDKKAQADLAAAIQKKKLNPVTPLIDAGIFQSITEDINVSKFTSQSALERSKIGKAAARITPSFLIPPLKQVFLTKDTYLFKTLLKATQYSDFIARYSKYRHLIEKEEYKNLPEGEEKEKAFNDILADIVEDFVNYDVPQNKYLQYANDIGLARFTKYWFRTQRIIVKKWKEQPTNMFLSYAIQQAIGDLPDITDSWWMFNLFTVSDSPWDVVADALDPKGLELAGDIAGLFFDSN